MLKSRKNYSEPNQLSIDLPGYIRCNKLYARLLWCELHAAIKPHRFPHFRYDNFLCDLRVFEDQFEQYHKTGDAKGVFWWTWHPSGGTNVTDYNPHELNTYRIEFSEGKISAQVEVPDPIYI